MQHSILLDVAGVGHSERFLYVIQGISGIPLASLQANSPSLSCFQENKVGV